MGVGRRQRAHMKNFYVFLNLLFLGIAGMGLASVYFFLPLDVKRIILIFLFKAVKVVKKYFQ